MTLTGEALASLVAVIGTLAALYGTFVKNAKDLGKMELKVDTLWDFQMRRAATEAVRKGIATVNSPVIVNEEAKRWMAPLIEPIRAFYRKLGRNMTDRELYFEIERRFGEQIYQEVCIPHGLDQGACLLIALQAVRD